MQIRESYSGTGALMLVLALISLQLALGRMVSCEHLAESSVLDSMETVVNPQTCVRYFTCVLFSRFY